MSTTTYLDEILQASNGAGEVDAEIVFYSELEMRSIDWLWKPFLQRSAFHLLAGKKGSGKGTLLALLQARYLRGDFGETDKTVLVLSSEDSTVTDSLPRLIAAGGDPARVIGVKKPIRLPNDIEWLRAKIELYNVGFLIIDPIGNHLGGVNTDSEGLIREAIAPLNSIAHDFDCIVIGVRHTSKNVDRGMLSSVLGSTAWVDVARSVLGLAVDNDADEEGILVLEVLASNRGPSGSGQMFRIELADVGLKEPVTKAIDLGPATKSIDEILANSGPKKSGWKMRETQEIILRELMEGSKSKAEMWPTVLAEVGCSERTFDNAVTELKKNGELYFPPRPKRPDGQWIEGEPWRMARGPKPLSMLVRGT